jgi:hypothetical protein
MLHLNRPANLSILIPKRQWQTKYKKKNTSLLMKNEVGLAESLEMKMRLQPDKVTFFTEA